MSHSTCSIHICLRWTSRQDILNIICKIDDLHLPVYIHNNFGEEIARCSIPFPFPWCSSTNNNTFVKQNVYTNETIVRVRRRIDHNINGNWSCRHGIGRNTFEADIEINIPKLKGNVITSYKKVPCIFRITCFISTLNLFNQHL